MENPSSSRSVIRLASNERFWDWRMVLITIALVEISSTRLVITKWVPYLYFTQIMGFAGIVLGLALGYSTFSRRAVIRIAMGYTLILLPTQLLTMVERTEWLWEDVLVLFVRQIISIGQFINGQPVYDQLFFVSLVTIGYWMIGLCAGYWLTRHKNFMSVILPSGIAILIIHSFDSFLPSRVWGLAVYIFAALIMLGREYLLENQSFWKKTNVMLTPETIGDFERGALALAAVAVFIAWSLPGWISSIQPAAHAWNEFSRPVMNRLSDAVSALESSYAKSPSGDFYSSQLALGRQAATGDTPLFFVHVKNSGFVPVRYYWKGRAYDLYRNGSWTTVSDASEEFHTEIDQLNVEYPKWRNKMEFTITTNAPRQSLLYAPAEITWVDLDGKITSTPISEQVSDVTSWFAVPSLLIGNQYKAQSLIADPSIEELRLASAEYPEWVTDRYLQVPNDIEPQLNALATEITAPYDNVYDKVDAITNYLRNEIAYETKITVIPPQNKDPLLWVLFEYKKGFCMYYASAETLMLRSIGIPARLAVGFAEGEYDELKDQFIVTYKDSHAWPEVYFPGIGWVEFEPTVNQFPLERPEVKINIEQTPVPDNGANPASDQQATPLPLEEPAQLADENVITRESAQAILYRRILYSTLILLSFGLGIFIIRRYSLDDRVPVYLAQRFTQNGNTPPLWLDRWVRWVNLSQMERAFQAINLSLYWLDHPQAAHVTSQERAQALMDYLPSAEEQTSILLQEYQTTLYTQRAGNLIAARKAAVGILLKAWQFRMKKP